jgi:hypothetical protein
LFNRSVDATVKTVRILAMVMLSFLYIGGTVAHVYGAAYPIIGSGNKAVDGFQGNTKEPVRPTITECRHVPLVKTVVVPSLLVIDQPCFEHTEVSQFAFPLGEAPLLLAVDVSSCCDRAPPLA